MIITKWEIYCIGFLLIALPFILTRAYWIKKSVKVNAVALSINKARSKRSASQTYPVFKYYTPDEIGELRSQINELSEQIKLKAAEFLKLNCLLQIITFHFLFQKLKPQIITYLLLSSQ